MPDVLLDHRAKPNCTSRIKAAEGPWVTNYYNACGYRTDQPCDQRPPGTLRISLLGSSTAQGYLVPYESSIGASLHHKLTEACGRNVQVENMAMFNYRQAIIYAQLHEALALQPDMMLFMVQAFDFDRDEDNMANAEGTGQQSPELLHQVRNLMINLRFMEVAQHFMFEDSDRYASIYLNNGDRADFLRPPFTTAWQKRLAYFDNLLGRMQTVIDHRVPMVLVLIPIRAQAALLANPHRPAGIDPFAFGHAVGQIATAHGMSYIDLSEPFSHDMGAGNLYYPQNGHLNARGDVTVANEIAGNLGRELACIRAISSD